MDPRKPVCYGREWGWLALTLSSSRVQFVAQLLVTRRGNAISCVAHEAGELFFSLLHTDQPNQAWPPGLLLPPFSPSAAVWLPWPPRFHRRKSPVFSSASAPESQRSLVTSYDSSWISPPLSWGCLGWDVRIDIYSHVGGGGDGEAKSDGEKKFITREEEPEQ
jgi:hypothetical protein